MIDELLPPAVSACEAFEDASDPELFPEEERLVARAVRKRRQEFATVRMCARRALAGIGVAPLPLLHGARGAPVWPEAVVGSMTHCAGYRAAAVAWSRDVLTIGLDAEVNRPLPSRGVLETVTVAEERARLTSLAGRRPDVHWDRLVFSAKESVYKAWFPLTGRWLGFDEAEIHIDPGTGTFTAALRVPGPVAGGSRLTGFTGGWLARDGLLVTAVTVSPPLPAASRRRRGGA
ncbi:4'-phosphopantetheinyl transferase [Streptosporangium violaceochromogenes]|nr:4'-phosphopantetheinyl transferase [Streptosporangium violaceochromogenes]